MMDYKVHFGRQDESRAFQRQCSVWHALLPPAIPLTPKPEQTELLLFKPADHQYGSGVAEQSLPEARGDVCSSMSVGLSVKVSVRLMGHCVS